MSEGRGRLIVTAKTMARVLDTFRGELEQGGWVVETHLPNGQFFDSKELTEVCSGATAAIIGDDEASDEFFRKTAPHLQLLVKWGVGTDTIDFRSAQQHGVVVRNTPGAFGNEVADLAMGYVLALARHIVDIHNNVSAGEWKQVTGQTLKGKTIGLVGLGSIGQAVAMRAPGFGMTVIYSDPFVDEESLHVDAKRLEIPELFRDADFVVLTCPSTEETKALANSKTFALMKPSAYLINVARGDLVVETDLHEALAHQLLAGAALDVFEHEPLSEHSPLRSHSNVIFGAHNGSNTYEGLLNASRVATDIVLAWSGKESG